MTDFPMLMTLGAGALTVAEITRLLMGLGVLLICARLLGETARALGQPQVVGELLAGILLGPSVLGAFAPDLAAAILPKDGNAKVAFEGFTVLAITLYLLVAGMEVDLSTIWKQGRSASIVGLAGIAIPFGVGFAAAYFAPDLLGKDRESDITVVVFALFFATALSISALPMIAKTLMDLNMFRSDFGMIIISAAVFNDLVGWVIFAIILGMIGAESTHGLPIGAVIGLTLGFAVFCLTVLRWLVHRSLPFLQARLQWPGGVLSLAMGLALLGAAFTEWLGVHAIFGAFLVGVAIGDSPRLRESTRQTLENFISYIFAPLFFASVGLLVDFRANFDPMLTTVVLIIACVGKVLGCQWGARLAGMDKRESWALGFAMNARGTMEIILGLLALQFGLINERLFVALVIMALVTSIVSGPVMQKILRRRKPVRVADALSQKAFVRRLQAASRESAIRELSQALGKAAGLDADLVFEKTWAREQVASTGLDGGVAVPHARIEGLQKPVIALGITADGMDFNALDGGRAHLVFLILTPEGDYKAQLELLGDIGRTFRNREAVERALDAESVTEFLALLRTSAQPAH